MRPVGPAPQERRRPARAQARPTSSMVRAEEKVREHDVVQKNQWAGGHFI